MSLSPEQRQQWKQADDCFSQYLLEQPTDVRAWRNGLALDEAVSQRLQQLIDAHHSTGSPLDQTLSGWLPDQSSADDALLGRRIGDWLLEQPIGRGGMASVYRARRDTDSFDQVAAVKLLNVGLISSQLRDHFDQEQQILAALQHPHIAGLLDAGLADDGTPFIAMEYVDGHRIDQHVAEARLDPSAVVRLFLQVCDAVAFAQQNLIVHRDLKPSNILVDSRGNAQLLDFGIARLMEDSDAEATTTRAFTPGYAAPEQRAGRQITTATDVYALGAVLYQLLTGRSPEDKFDADGQLSPDALVELRRQDGDLANIVAMAARPESQRRYASAAELAQDLRLWQQNRPIVASPDSAAYRLGKYFRRHRVGVTAAVLSIVIGAAGIASTVWQARRAQQALVQANANAEQAQAVQNFLIEMFDAADPWTNQNDPLTANQLLDSALQRLPDQLQEYPLQKASVMRTLGRILRNLGQHEQAATQARGAAELFKRSGHVADTVDAQILHANILVDALDHEPVEALLRDAIAVSEQHGLVADNMRARMDLARLFTHNARYEEQGELINGLLTDLPAIMDQPEHADLVGSIYATAAENHENTGSYEQAVAAAREAEKWMVQAVGENHPNVADALGYQATASYFLGRWELAEQAMRRTIAIMEDHYPGNHPSLLWAHYQLGRVLLDAGQFERSLSHYQQFYPRCVELFGAQDPRTAMAQTNLGLSFQGTGQLEEAKANLAQSVPLIEAQSGDNPKVGVAMTRYGSVLSELGEVTRADQEFNRGLEFLAATRGQDHPLYARSATLYAQHQLRHGNAQGALKTLGEILPALKSGYGEDSEFTWIADLYRGLALAQLGHSAEAAATLESAVAGLQQERYQTKYREPISRAKQVLARELTSTGK